MKEYRELREQICDVCHKMCKKDGWQPTMEMFPFD